MTFKFRLWCKANLSELVNFHFFHICIDLLIILVGVEVNYLKFAQCWTEIWRRSLRFNLYNTDNIITRIVKKELINHW